MCVLTKQNSEPWSGRSCVADRHVSIRHGWYEMRGMVGGRKCRWVNHGCQPKYCSTYHRIALGLLNPSGINCQSCRHLGEPVPLRQSCLRSPEFRDDLLCEQADREHYPLIGDLPARVHVQRHARDAERLSIRLEADTIVRIHCHISAQRHPRLRQPCPTVVSHRAQSHVQHGRGSGSLRQTQLIRSWQVLPSTC